MDALELLKGYLEKTQNFSATEFSSLQNEDGSLKDEAPELLLSHHAKSVATQRDTAKKQKDKEKQDEFKRGWKENNDLWDGNLKEIGVDLEGVQDGKEKFDRLKTHVSTLAAKSTELTEDQVKNLPAFRKRETELSKQVTAKEEEWKKKWDERDAKEHRDRTVARVKARAEELKQTLNPVLPEDIEMRKRQLRLLDMDIEALDYSEDEQGNILMKRKNGERVEKLNGQPMTVDEYLDESIRSNYPIPVGKDKTNAGNVTKDTKQGNGAVVKPANRKEYAEQMSKLADDFTLKPEEKAAKLQELKAFEATLAG